VSSGLYNATLGGVSISAHSGVNIGNGLGPVTTP
jgi:hypothetical protein